MASKFDLSWIEFCSQTSSLICKMNMVTFHNQTPFFIGDNNICYDCHKRRLLTCGRRWVLSGHVFPFEEKSIVIFSFSAIKFGVYEDDRIFLVPIATITLKRQILSILYNVAIDVIIKTNI